MLNSNSSKDEQVNTMAERVSLAHIVEPPAAKFRRASSDSFSVEASPTLKDLTEALFFSPGDGRIWLNDQRMILLHTASFGALRRELIETIGTEKARELLTRVGYSSGARDAELVRRRWPEGDPSSAFAGGPRLHSLEGVVKVTTVKFEFDVDRGFFYGEYLWHDAMEAAEHIAAYGIGSDPACWMQIGYASGYASAFLGKLVVYREIQCRAMGAECCHLIGRPLDSWPDAGEVGRYFRINVAPEGSAAKAGPAKTARRASKGAVPQVHDDGAVLGMSSAFRAARHMLERVARTSATVLFTGESGVGKELFARTLHKISARQRGPFVAVNCAAIPETLIEAELFGVERGAYTGAHASRAGRFERASGGTLFLDEISSLSLVAQGKLLRALQEAEIDRVGGTKPTKIDVRVVAASNVDLRREIEARRFRSDLFFRLNVFPIDLPPLRERRDDIPILMDYFLAFYAEKHGRRTTGFTARAIEAMLNYDYSGNVRELQNLIERAVIFAEDDSPVDTVHLFRQGENTLGGSFGLSAAGALRETEFEIRDESGNSGTRRRQTDAGSLPSQLAQSFFELGGSLADFEQQIYSEALSRSHGNLAAAARQVGLSRAQLEYRIRRGRKADLTSS
jgi:DNA-binding NtrC family response regulator/predicted hydrocarbon binding protein